MDKLLRHFQNKIHVIVQVIAQLLIKLYTGDTITAITVTQFRLLFLKVKKLKFQGLTFMNFGVHYARF